MFLRQQLILLYQYLLDLAAFFKAANFLWVCIN
jgi:hypothetical protein